MDENDQSDRPEQASLELLSLEGAEINSKTHMDDTNTIQTREMSGVAVSFGPGMEVVKVASSMTSSPPLRSCLNSEILPTMMRATAVFRHEDAARKASEFLNQSPKTLGLQQILMVRMECQVEFKGSRECIQNMLGLLYNRPSIYWHLNEMNLALSLDGEPCFSRREEYGKALVKAMKWLNEHPVSDQIHEEQPVSRGVATTDEHCVICGYIAEAPVVTQCEHIYCGDCLYNLCSSTFSIGSSQSRAICQASNKSCPSTPFGNFNCGSTFTLSDLQRLLEPDAFERFLLASFKLYVHRHPEKLNNCPTADCDYIYFVSKPDDNAAIAKHITCPHCLANICTRCQEGHNAREMTCLELQHYLAQEEGSIARVKEEQGIKNCPKCRASLEKVDGCDHVVCLVCSSHLCWLCLELFEGPSASQDTYEHLEVVHDERIQYDWEEDYWGDESEEEEHHEEKEEEGDDDQRFIGNIVNLRIEEGPGEQADTGQEDGADVSRESTADQDLKAEEEQEGPRNRRAPEASFGGIRLERMPQHEIRPEDGRWFENRRLENQRMNEGVPPRLPPVLVEILVTLYEFPYTWVFFSIISRLREATYRLVYYALRVFSAVFWSCALVLRQMVFFCLVLIGNLYGLAHAGSIPRNEEP